MYLYILYFEHDSRDDFLINMTVWQYISFSLRTKIRFILLQNSISVHLKN